MTHRIIKDRTELNEWLSLLERHTMPMTVSVIKGADRTGQQNRLAHKWFSQIGSAFGDPMHTVKARCKYRFGLPIMRRDNPDWVAYWKPLYQPLIDAGMRENAAKAFEAIPMTSKFTSRQMAEFMSAIQQTYLPMGIHLIDPEARKYEREMESVA